MNNKLSKITLVISIICVLVINIVLINMNKPNAGLTDISGNKEEIGDMNIVYTKREGLFNGREFILNKDGNKVNNFSKIYETDAPNQDMIALQENTDLIDNINYSVEIYSDENSVGFVDIASYYEIVDNDKATERFFVSCVVQDKDLETNKITEREFNINIKPEFDDYISYEAACKKYNNDIYLSLLLEIDRNDYETNEVYENKGIKHLIYKLSLETNEVDLVSEYNLDKESKMFFNEVNNTTKDYIYELVYTDDKVNLISYDLKNDEFNLIEISDLSLDNAYNFITFENEENEVYYAQIKDLGNSQKQLQIINIDLENNNIKGMDKYYIESKDYKDTLGLENIRIHDNKIYVLAMGYGPENERYPSDYPSEYIYVIDKDNKNTLYNGKIEGEFANMRYLFTNEELN